MSHDSAGIVVPPPLVYVGSFLLGLGLDRILPLTPVPPAFGVPIALVLGAVWLVLMVGSFGRFWSAGTSVLPVRPSTSLVVTGPYRFSRNPMYLSLLALYSALALGLGFTWPLLLAPALMIVVDRWIVGREERYLTRTFGEGYLQYQRQVRRWI